MQTSPVVNLKCFQRQKKHIDTIFTVNGLIANALSTEWGDVDAEVIRLQMRSKNTIWLASKGISDGDEIMRVYLPLFVLFDFSPIRSEFSLVRFNSPEP